jgi:hypothetical protein
MYFREKNLLTFVLALGSLSSMSQTLLAGWDFQTTINGGTALAVAPSTPTVIIANFGQGTLYLDGSNSSSTWNTTITDNEISAFSGCYLNTGPGFSRITTGAAALGLLGGTNVSANGKSMVFKFTMTGKSKLIVNYITQSTLTGFTSHSWDYSSTGITWTPLQTIINLPIWSLELVTLDTIKGLDNVETAYLRVSLAGATEAAGMNKFDNIQFNAYTTVFPGSEVVPILSDENISISNGIISFYATSGKCIEIYNAVGQKLLKKVTVEGMNTIQISVKGVIILKIDSRTLKIIL